MTYQVNQQQPYLQSQYPFTPQVGYPATCAPPPGFPARPPALVPMQPSGSMPYAHGPSGMFHMQYLGPQHAQSNQGFLPPPHNSQMVAQVAYPVFQAAAAGSNYQQNQYAHFHPQEAYSVSQASAASAASSNYQPFHALYHSQMSYTAYEAASTGGENYQLNHNIQNGQVQQQRIQKLNLNEHVTRFKISGCISYFSNVPAADVMKFKSGTLSVMKEIVSLPDWHLIWDACMALSDAEKHLINTCNSGYGKIFDIYYPGHEFSAASRRLSSSAREFVPAESCAAAAAASQPIQSSAAFELFRVQGPQAVSSNELSRAIDAGIQEAQSKMSDSPPKSIKSSPQRTPKRKKGSITVDLAPDSAAKRTAKAKMMVQAQGFAKKASSAASAAIKRPVRKQLFSSPAARSDAKVLLVATKQYAHTYENGLKSPEQKREVKTRFNRAIESGELGVVKTLDSNLFEFKFSSGTRVYGSEIGSNGNQKQILILASGGKNGQSDDIDYAKDKLSELVNNHFAGVRNLDVSPNTAGKKHMTRAASDGADQ